MMSTKLTRLYYKKRSDLYYWRRAMKNKMGIYTYAVITSVPDPTKDGGNLASATFAMPGEGCADSDLYLENSTYQFRNGKEVEVDRKPYAVTYDDMRKVLKSMENFKDLDWRMPVFTLGEIVILNAPYGREIAGKQRKPGKWNVEVEEFKSLRKAEKRAMEVINAAYV